MDIFNPMEPVLLTSTTRHQATPYTAHLYRNYTAKALTPPSDYMEAAPKIRTADLNP